MGIEIADSQLITDLVACNTPTCIQAVEEIRRLKRLLQTAVNERNDAWFDFEELNGQKASGIQWVRSSNQIPLVSSRVLVWYENDVHKGEFNCEQNTLHIRELGLCWDFSDDPEENPEFETFASVFTEWAPCNYPLTSSAGF